MADHPGSDRSTVQDWFLSRGERANRATRIPIWTEGNDVTPLVNGSTYAGRAAAAPTGRRVI